MDTHTKSLVNITIPVYNEEVVVEESLRTLLAFLRESNFPYPYKVIVVDNGSTDRTVECVRSLAHEYDSLSLVTIAEKGKGRAIRRGWEEGGDILLFMDVDLATDLRALRSLVDAIAIEGASVAIGNRLGKGSRIHDRRFAREVMSRTYNLLVRLLFMSGITDHQCGFKAISATAFKTLATDVRDNGWFFDTELLVLARSKEYLVREVDVEWWDKRESKVSLIRTPMAMLEGMLKLRLRLMRRSSVLQSRA